MQEFFCEYKKPLEVVNSACQSILLPVWSVNPLTPKGSPFDEKNRLALDRVKSIKVARNSFQHFPRRSV